MEFPATPQPTRRDQISRSGEPLTPIFDFLVAVLGSGTNLKSFLDEFRFILADYELKRTHGDPIRVNFYVFPCFAACWMLPDE